MAVSDIPKGKKRRGDTPSESLARIIIILVALLRDEVIDYQACLDRFGVDPRVFQRDLKKLREVGKTCGFKITHRIRGRVHLIHDDRRMARLAARSRESTETLVRIALALGGPIQYSLLEGARDSHPRNSDPGARQSERVEGFLQLREPRPLDGAALQPTFEFLKQAAESNAQVEFSYKGNRGPRSTRRVEPYHVVVRGGRAYLVAYDCNRRGWRQFGLDSIRSPIRRVGTYRKRPVPPELLENAVGWMRSGPDVEVTIRLSPIVAASVLATQVNNSQRVRTLPDGGAEVTMVFGDLLEAARWTMSRGAEAKIIDPPRAVEVAREAAQAVAGLYRDARASRAPDTLTA